MNTTWIEKLYHSVFSSKQLDEVVVKEVIEELPEVLTEVGVIRKKFNPATDMIVLSKDKFWLISKEDQDWLISNDDRIFYFVEDTLTNIAIVRAGYSNKLF